LLGNSDARTLLTAADAFVLDSFFEGWPVAATEAAAFGHPVILSDVGGARELVDRDPRRSVLIPNAAGAADGVSDRRV
ncbi:glycosyltransferase, partial [Rhizobium johnstonii]